MSNNIFALPSLANVQGIAPPVKKRPLLLPADGDDYILQIDNSTMEKYQTCPQSAKYYCIDRRERPERTALVFGGAVHAGLETYYRDPHNPNILSFMVEAAFNHFAKETFDPGDDYRTPEYASQVLMAYYNQYSFGSDFIPIIHNDVPAVEIPFKLNIGSFEVNQTLSFTRGELLGDCEDPNTPIHIKNLHIQWTGKIDLVGLNTHDQLTIVDHKTSSIAGANFFNDFVLSQQTRGYTWAAEKIIGRRPDFFAVNALFCRKPTRTGKGVEFARQTFHYDSESLAEWLNDTLAAVESFVNSLIHANFPKYTKWCMGKYGQCPYFNVCKLHPTQRQAALSSSEYVNVTWSPLT